jgi:hypothetical protein
LVVVLLLSGEGTLGVAAPSYREYEDSGWLKKCLKAKRMTQPPNSEPALLCVLCAFSLLALLGARGFSRALHGLLLGTPYFALFSRSRLAATCGQNGQTIQTFSRKLWFKCKMWGAK